MVRVAIKTNSGDVLSNGNVFGDTRESFVYEDVPLSSIKIIRTLRSIKLAVFVSSLNDEGVDHVKG